MNGHILEEKIALLAGGDLGDKETAELERHLSECGTCSARVENYREDRRALSVLREAGIDECDCDSVRRSVMQQLPMERRFRLGFAPLRWALLSAAVLIAAVIGIGYWSRTPGPQRAGSPQAGERQVEPKPAKPALRAGATAETGPARPSAARVAVMPRVPQRKSSPVPSLPAVNIAAETAAIARRPQVQDEVIIKLETSDPNVVIIWLASPKGGER